MAPLKNVETVAVKYTASRTVTTMMLPSRAVRKRLANVSGSTAPRGASRLCAGPPVGAAAEMPLSVVPAIGQAETQCGVYDTPGVDLVPS